MTVAEGLSTHGKVNGNLENSPTIVEGRSRFDQCAWKGQVALINVPGAAAWNLGLSSAQPGQEALIIFASSMEKGGMQQHTK